MVNYSQIIGVGKLSTRRKQVKEVQAIKVFKRFLQVEKGLSANSIYSYTYDLKKFSEFLSTKKKDIMHATSEDIVQFLKFEKTKKKNSTRTMARSLAAIRQFYNFISDKYDNVDNPTVKIESPHVEKTLPDFLTVKEIEKLF